MDSLYIAWQYVRFNRVKTVILVACITLIVYLPLSLHLLLEESERTLRARSAGTPLLLGARGSALDLVMNSLYFDGKGPEAVSMAAAQAVMDTELAVAVPLYVRFQARGFPIVGTTLDYFALRGLRVERGRLPAILGEIVLGAEVARRLGLGTGAHLVSSPENLFDLAGVYPLRMQVVGVLAPSHTADDRAVFTDVKTAWVIEGLGHGHENLVTTGDTSVILDRDESSVTANAKLVQFTEITPANLYDFHFHGDPGQYPLSAVMAYPHDEKSGTILRGRYTDHERHQILVPARVVDGLLERIFRIKSVLDAVIMMVSIATLLALVLVFGLSLRLRQREMDTIFRLGCSRLMTARLLAAEMLIILGISITLSGAAALATGHFSGELVRHFFI